MASHMDIRGSALAARQQSRKLQSLDGEERKSILLLLADLLISRQKEILSANEKDVKAAEAANMSGVMLARLILTEKKLHVLSSGIRQIADSDDPIGRILSRTIITDGLDLQKVSVPLGVLLIIFESRPDCLPQIAALAIKSGNGLLLKGGAEASHSNLCLAEITRTAIVQGSKQQVTGDVMTLVNSREEVSALLQLDDVIDLIIPRGSSQLVKYIQSNTRIPVMGHSEGVCHVYVDLDADLLKAIQVVLDSKNDYPAACNAMETLLIHQDLCLKTLTGEECEHAQSVIREFQNKTADKSETDRKSEIDDLDFKQVTFAEMLIIALRQTGVQVHGGIRAQKTFVKFDLPIAEDLHHEYGDLACTVEIVDDAPSAILHINSYSSAHTDSIVTENKTVGAIFTTGVDSACVFVNTSTRFADGFRFGLGAEVGISTSRLHARGPVGVDGLTTTKSIMRSVDVHTLQQYNTGKWQYVHKNVSVKSNDHI